MSNSKEFLANLDLLRVLVPGDMVEFPRGCYSHYGIYVGDGYVIHLTSEEKTQIVCSSMLSFLSSSSSGITEKRLVKGTVIQQSFFDIAKNVKAKKNNYLDGKHSPRLPKKIVKEAQSKLNKQSDYHPVFKNCEHFATWCRYGVAHSQQAENISLCLCSPSIQESIPW